MTATTPRTALRAFLYGAAAMLLVVDTFYLFRALLTFNFVPMVPIIVGILTSAGLLLIVYAEQRAREEDKKDHRRISRVAHQLESPLRALHEDLEQLLKNADRLPSDERLKLKRMETKTHVLLDNIRDVFLMLQASEQPLTQERRLYNVCTILNQVLEQQQVLARARNVELVYQPKCVSATVSLDRHLFMIALRHIIENAITYTMTPGLVNIVVTKNSKTVRILVQDRGIGITTDEHSVVFQPFARGYGAEAYDPDGIGVGLTLSKLIIAEWGGRLSFKPRATSMGTEFEITLPLAKKK